MQSEDKKYRNKFLIVGIIVLAVAGLLMWIDPFTAVILPFISPLAFVLLPLAKYFASAVPAFITETTIGFFVLFHCLTYYLLGYAFDSSKQRSSQQEKVSIKRILVIIIAVILITVFFGALLELNSSLSNSNFGL